MSTGRIPQESLKKLKEIHYRKTGELLTDIEAEILGLRILNFLELFKDNSNENKGY